MNITLSSLAQKLDATFSGDGTTYIRAVKHPLEAAEISDLAWATDDEHLRHAIASKAQTVAVSLEAELPKGRFSNVLRLARPRFALAHVTSLFAHNPQPQPGIHATAVVEEDVKIGKNVAIGAFVFIGKGASIGDNVILHPQVYVGSNASIGNNSIINSGARIGADVTIGERCLIHFNASIGADGFSFVTQQVGSVESAKATGNVEVTNDKLARIASLGSVIIGNDVEIGANSCIDRGTLSATRVGDGTKIDNHVQIGHNVTVGENVLICGRTGIAGSARIGNRVVLGGGVGVADHVTIGDDVVAMALSGIAGNVAPRSLIAGIPAEPREKMIEKMMNIARLKGLFARLKKIEDKLS